MSKRYNYEFKKQIVTLVNNGKRPNEIVKEYKEFLWKNYNH
ncbi:hypothetical protein [Senegalia sp. (in: firmicutes)]